MEQEVRRMRYGHISHAPAHHLGTLECWPLTSSGPYRAGRGEAGRDRTRSNTAIDTARSSAVQRPSGDSWKHDKYEETKSASSDGSTPQGGSLASRLSNSTAPAAAGKGAKTTKLIIKDLHYEVSERELEVRSFALSQRGTLAQRFPCNSFSLFKSDPSPPVPRSKYGYNLIILPPRATLERFFGRAET